MRALIEEHGGAVVTAAIVILLIGIITIIGKTDFLQEIFKNILNGFVEQAQQRAGY